MASDKFPVAGVVSGPSRGEYYIPGCANDVWSNSYPYREPYLDGRSFRNRKPVRMTDPWSDRDDRHKSAFLNWRLTKMIKVSRKESLIPYEHIAKRILAKVEAGGDIEVEIENEFWKIKIARMNRDDPARQ